MVFNYFVTLIVIIITVINTLYFKSELEKMFREKRQVFAFHLCNVLLILMTSLGAHAVITIYVLKNEFKWFQQIIILLLIILPIYTIGHYVYEKYKFINRKYIKEANGKVLIINERYLKKKNRNM